MQYVQLYGGSLPGMKNDSWIQVYIHTYSYFGGITRILIPDNAKVAVVKNIRTELSRNRSYQDVVEYYGTAIVPVCRFYRRTKPLSRARSASCQLGSWYCMFQIIIGTFLIFAISLFVDFSDNF